MSTWGNQKHIGMLYLYMTVELANTILLYSYYCTLMNVSMEVNTVGDIRYLLFDYVL